MSIVLFYHYFAILLPSSNHFPTQMHIQAIHWPSELPSPCPRSLQAPKKRFLVNSLNPKPPPIQSLFDPYRVCSCDSKVLKTDETLSRKELLIHTAILKVMSRAPHARLLPLVRTLALVSQGQLTASLCPIDCAPSSLDPIRNMPTSQFQVAQRTCVSWGMNSFCLGKRGCSR